MKSVLCEIRDKLAELEDAARKLQNQNLADIIHGARVRAEQASEHPDLERVEGEGEPAALEPFPGSVPVPSPVPPSAGQPYVPPQNGA